jgi:DnaJ-class molecular chaperone
MCTHCGGVGEVEVCAYRTVDGEVIRADMGPWMTCPHCEGEGAESDDDEARSDEG